jgi:hypothetical protein
MVWGDPRFTHIIYNHTTVLSLLSTTKIVIDRDEITELITTYISCQGIYVGMLCWLSLPPEF